jgi:hypothetical protein
VSLDGRETKTQQQTDEEIRHFNLETLPEGEIRMNETSRTSNYSKTNEKLTVF